MKRIIDYLPTCTINILCNMLNDCMCKDYENVSHKAELMG